MTTELNYKAEIFAEYLILKGYSIRSKESMQSATRRFAKWSEQQNIEMENISYNDVLFYIDHCRKKGNKPSTLRLEVNGIRHYYNFLIHENELVENPCSNVIIKGVKRKILYEIFTPTELETIYQTYGGVTSFGSGIGSPVAHKRNKLILGLLIYQGLKSEEVANLKVSDIKMREGKVFVAGARRTNQRELTLEAHQLYDLIDYIGETRKLLLQLSGRTTENLFLSLGTGTKFNNVMDKLIKQLKKQDSRIKNVKQLRASVITNWLKTDNIRQVQHKAGHRYVGSTEGYQANNMDNLKDDISKFHPDI